MKVGEYTGGSNCFREIHSVRDFLFAGSDFGLHPSVGNQNRHQIKASVGIHAASQHQRHTTGKPPGGNVIVEVSRQGETVQKPGQQSMAGSGFGQKQTKQNDDTQDNNNHYGVFLNIFTQMHQGSGDALHIRSQLDEYLVKDG